jgi:hypothetical protein
MILFFNKIKIKWEYDSCIKIKMKKKITIPQKWILKKKISSLGNWKKKQIKSNEKKAWVNYSEPAKSMT